MIYDITQPLFECAVFPGDPKPERETLLSIENGDVCNLTYFKMCAHNGTHIDAPYHFINTSYGVDEIPLDKLIGMAYVSEEEGNIDAKRANEILENARQQCKESAKRILIKGKAVVTNDAAKVFAENNIDLIGNESQTVGPENAPREVHLTLLSKNIVLLEGIRLEKVPTGVYYLNCAPLNLTKADGSPCRAILDDSIVIK